MTNSANNAARNQLIRIGANGHVHHFGIVEVHPEFGHTYWRCEDCHLSILPPEHDPATCAICGRSRVSDGEGEWFDLALRYLRGDPALTDVPYSSDSVFADFLRFWDSQTPHFRLMIRSVFEAAPSFTVTPTED